MQEHPNNPRQGLLYYYCIAMLCLLLFNAFITPIIVNRSIEAVGA